ncbi:MAG: nucleoside hydrolase [Cyanobacteriota bacterium]|nr:nucleoside hydrolase [Cyanobacteriota bacterium]
MSKPLVLLDHDGGIDDYLSVLLLMTMENVEPIGFVVTPADCYIEPALGITRKLLDLLDRPDIPVAASTVRGINPFPPLYRRDSYIIDHLPILNESGQVRTPLVAESGQTWMVRAIREAIAPVTLMVTGPLTTVATALDAAPDIEAKIEKIVWMGGALEVPGNVESVWEPGHDGSAEWNAFWDPIAVDRVWQTQIPIVLCSLDITNQVPVTSEFVRQIASQRRYPLSDFAGQCYALAIPQDFYFWDVLATAYLARPEFYKLEEVETAIVTEGRSQGRTKIQPGGRKIQMMKQVQVDRFYRYILEQWTR